MPNTDIAIQLIEVVLAVHEGSLPDLPPRVWLNEFESDHIELRLICWYPPPDYWNHTQHADQMNRLILNALETNDIQLAVPAFTTRVEDPMGAAVIPPQS